MWSYAHLEGLVALVQKAADEGRFVPDPDLPITVECSKELALQWVSAAESEAIPPDFFGNSGN